MSRVELLSAIVWLRVCQYSLEGDDSFDGFDGSGQRRFGDEKDKCKLLIGDHVAMMSL
jgi:hypothetical protein